MPRKRNVKGGEHEGANPNDPVTIKYGDTLIGSLDNKLNQAEILTEDTFVAQNFKINYTPSASEIKVDGMWKYIVNSDNTFTAWYDNPELPLAITTASGSAYRSEREAIPLPADIRNIFVWSCVVNVVKENYPVWSIFDGYNNGEISFTTVSGGSRNRTNYRCLIRIDGEINIAKPVNIRIVNDSIEDVLTHGQPDGYIQDLDDTTISTPFRKGEAINGIYYSGTDVSFVVKYNTFDVETWEAVIEGVEVINLRVETYGVGGLTETRVYFTIRIPDTDANISYKFIRR